MKNKFIFISLFACGVFLGGNHAQAYYSQIILGEKNVQVTDPESTQIFYRELAGQENVFNIISKKTFKLHLVILEPNVVGARKNFSMEISKDGGGIAFVDGLSLLWKNFYDPFAGDNYWRGPEYDLTAEAGVYEIKITNPERAGKYALVVGKTETFSVDKELQSFLLIPQIKSYFFNESPLAAYGNQATLLLGVSLISILGAGIVAAMAYRSRR